MNLRAELIQYSNDVLGGSITACQKHKWACQRFLHNLEFEGTNEFPYIFDEAKGKRFLDWMRLFKHRKGVLHGKNIEPDIIQSFIFGNIYGWYHKDTGYRRFKKAYWQVGRKNAKSQSLGCVGSYELMAFDGGSNEVYCAATKTEQAKIVWDETRSMLDGCKELKGKYKVAYGKIEHLKTASVMRALSKEDRKTGDGLNPQCGIVDEYHAHDTAEIYDIIDSGMVARPEPLLIIITTAGFDLSHPCYSVEYNLVSKILDPDNPLNIDSYFVMINELDKDDDIKDEANWVKANPILCSYSEGVQSIRDRLKLALEAPEKMRDYLTKTMDVWIQQKENGYMQMDKWAACGVDKLPNTEKASVYIGVDLSAKIDLTAVGFEIQQGDKYIVKAHFFMPEDTLQRKTATDKVPYDLWVHQGWITATPGAVVDYAFVKQYIIDEVNRNDWSIAQICYDPWNATQFAQDMETDGYTMVEIRQGVRSMSEATKSFREMVLEKRVIHDKNPVLAWNISNAVTRSDPNENMMLDKSKSTERIDGIAALINAHVQVIKNVDEENVYETRGVR